jgi:hypothetical protein
MRQFLISLGTFFLTALICNYVYIWTDLKNLFGAEPTFNQWLSLELILNILVVGPLNKTPKEKNDSKGSKISLDLP